MLTHCRADHFAPIDAVGAGRLGMRGTRRRIPLAGEEVQDAAAPAGRIRCRFRAAAPSGCRGCIPQALSGHARVPLEASRQAFEKEAQAPCPLRPVGARTEQQRRILAAQPAEDLRQHRRLAPRARHGRPRSGRRWRSEVSMPAPRRRSTTVTSWPAAARYHALVTPITPGAEDDDLHLPAMIAAANARSPPSKARSPCRRFRCRAPRHYRGDAFIAPTPARRLDRARQRHQHLVQRGDPRRQRPGRRSASETNIQDGSVLHVDPGFPMTLGRRVTVGHKVMLHGCTIGDGCADRHQQRGPQRREDRRRLADRRQQPDRRRQGDPGRRAGARLAGESHPGTEARRARRPARDRARLRRALAAVQGPSCASNPCPNPPASVTWAPCGSRRRGGSSRR